jgi:hypothetical protein
LHKRRAIYIFGCMFFFSNYYYYIVIGLQAICAIHCMRKGNQQKWLWLIIFLPLVGALIYIFTEMFTHREVQQVQSGLTSVFNPGGRISKLEENLRFSDTFNNRIALADAYLANGLTDKAISLYESSLTGAFTENEYVLTKLVYAYFDKQRYADLVTIVQKIYKLPQFARSRAHMLYALALEKEGKPDLAEKEFLHMKARYSYFESRYHYGLFLVRANRQEEAYTVFGDIVDEFRHLSSREKRYSQPWFNKAKDELKKMAA